MTKGYVFTVVCPHCKGLFTYRTLSAGWRTVTCPTPYCGKAVSFAVPPRTTP